MRMTIDESLQMVKDGRVIAINISGSDLDVCKYNQENIEALNTIVETVHKYQKIKQIINAVSYQPRNGYVCGGIFLTDEERVNHIRKVIKDDSN